MKKILIIVIIVIVLLAVCAGAYYLTKKKKPADDANTLEELKKLGPASQMFNKDASGKNVITPELSNAFKSLKLLGLRK